jgi:hypothetical protein
MHRAATGTGGSNSLLPVAGSGALLLALALAATPALAESVGCTPVSTIRWDAGAPVEHRYSRDEEFGPTIFGLDLETGEYREHIVGGRAGTSGGGRLEILSTVSAGSRDDFVAIDSEDGSHFRIRLAADPVAFMRTHASGEIDIGTCTTGDLMTAIEAAK